MRSCLWLLILSATLCGVAQQVPRVFAEELKRGYVVHLHRNRIPEHTSLMAHPEVFFLEGKIPSLGRTRIRIERIVALSHRAYFRTAQGLVTDSKHLAFVKASVRAARLEPSSWVPVWGALAESRRSAMLIFSNIRKPHSSDSFRELRVMLGSTLKTQRARLRRVPFGAAQGYTEACGVSESHRLTRSLQSMPDTRLVKVAQVAGESDIEWYQIFGEQSNTTMLANIAAASQIYERDLWINLEPASLITNTVPIEELSSIVVGQLLYDFTNYIADGHLGAPDIKHLFTGKVLEPVEVAGLANFGSACLYPSIATSLSRTVNPALDYLTFAHEVGHNFGAGHTPFNENPPSIMFPVNVGATQFSSQSQMEIAAYIDFMPPECFGSKLVDIPETPTPTPTPTPLAEPTTKATATAVPSPSPTVSNVPPTATATPAVSAPLSVRVTSQEVLRIAVSIPDETGAGCSYTISLSDAHTMLQATIRELPTGTSIFKTRVVLHSWPRASQLTFGLVGVCDSGANTKTVSAVELHPSRATKQLRKIGLRKWISYITNRLR